MRARRATVAALGLLALTGGLAACGQDAAGLEVGDLLGARDDGQFAEGLPATLELPIGRLEVFLGTPTATVAADDNRQLEAVEAPDGATFVPITWRYDAATFGTYTDYLGTEERPRVDLVVDGASYRLPAPDQVGEGSESFYVLVTGSTDDPSLEVDFDGVTQSLDLATGERDAGAAAALYDLEKARRKSTDCAGAATFDGTGFPDYDCRISKVARLPYANGEWAPDGGTWLVLTLTTGVSRYDVLGTIPGSGALYFGIGADDDVRVSGKEPSGRIVAPGTGCPANGACSSTYHLVFDVPERPRPRLELDQTFTLGLGSRWGGYDGKDELELGVRVDVPVA